MEKKLRRLDSFSAQGSDGQTYSVHAYEHLGRVEAFIAAQEQWEPLGVAEYKLADGRPVSVRSDGAMVVTESGVQLEREPSH